jgi:hypothetical protein
MAIWQFHIYFIPRQSLLNKYGKVPTQLAIDNDSWNNYFKNADLDNEPDFEDALTIHWWLDLNINLNNFLSLLTTFGKVQNWTEDADGLRSFGNAETNDISVCFNDMTKIVEEVSCRLDLRKIDKNFINKVLSLAMQFDCLLMDRQGRLCQPSMVALFDTIKLSNAERFVSNPKQFLDDLSKGTVAPE